MNYIEKLKDKKIPSSFDKIFSLIDKMLFFSEYKHDSLRFCIPNSLIDNILHLYHDNYDHPGHRRTYSIIILRYYFPKISKRMKRYINNCITYQISKSSHEKPLDLLHSIEIIDSYYTIIMDFIIDLSISHDYDILLTLMDKFSKVIRLIPCKTIISTEEIIQLYLKHIYSIFNLPVKFISNRNARFTSKFWSSLMKLLDIKLDLIVIFHLFTNDQSERTNSIIETMIHCFIDDDPDKYKWWIDYLPIIKHEYNNILQFSIGFSFNELYYVTKTKGISDLLGSMKSVSESAEELAEDIQKSSRWSPWFHSHRTAETEILPR